MCATGTYPPTSDSYQKISLLDLAGLEGIVEPNSQMLYQRLNSAIGPALLIAPVPFPLEQYVGVGKN